MTPVRSRIGAAADAVSIAALATQVFLDTYASEGVRPDLAREAFHIYSPEAFAGRLAEPDRVFLLAGQGVVVTGFAEEQCSNRHKKTGGETGDENMR